MQVELVPADRLVRPVIGPGSLSREEAVAEVQSILDRSAGASSVFGSAAQTWRRGAKDDTVYVGPFIWAVYEHPAGADPRRAAVEWLDDFAQTMRGAGMDVRVAGFPG